MKIVLTAATPEKMSDGRDYQKLVFTIVVNALLGIGRAFSTTVQLRTNGWDLNLTPETCKTLIESKQDCASFVRLIEDVPTAPQAVVNPETGAQTGRFTHSTSALALFGDSTDAALKRIGRFPRVAQAAAVVAPESNGVPA